MCQKTNHQSTTFQEFDLLGSTSPKPSMSLVLAALSFIFVDQIPQSKQHDWAKPCLLSASAGGDGCKDNFSKEEEEIKASKEAGCDSSHDSGDFSSIFSV